VDDKVFPYRSAAEGVRSIAERSPLVYDPRRLKLTDDKVVSSHQGENLTLSMVMRNVSSWTRVWQSGLPRKVKDHVVNFKLLVMNVYGAKELGGAFDSTRGISCCSQSSNSTVVNLQLSGNLLPAISRPDTALYTSTQ